MMMNAGTFELMRVWAAATGIALALWFFGELYLGLKVSETLPMLIAGIGGFEAFLFSQDVWRRRKSRV